VVGTVTTASSMPAGEPASSDTQFFRPGMDWTDVDWSEIVVRVATAVVALANGEVSTADARTQTDVADILTREEGEPDWLAVVSNVLENFRDTGEWTYDGPALDEDFAALDRDACQCLNDWALT